MMTVNARGQCRNKLMFGHPNGPFNGEHNSNNRNMILTLTSPTTTAADDIHKYFSLCFRENKTCCFK